LNQLLLLVLLLPVPLLLLPVLPGLLCTRSEGYSGWTDTQQKVRVTVQ
jgi:hypothetical protein